jgi:hypothetical protein
MPKEKPTRFSALVELIRILEYEGEGHPLLEIVDKEKEKITHVPILGYTTTKSVNPTRRGMGQLVPWGS